MRRYNASNPRLFGSVARGDATTNSVIDVIVDVNPMSGNPLMRLAGLSEEFQRVLGLRIDPVEAELLRETVSESSLADTVALWRDQRTSDSMTSSPRLIDAAATESE